MKLCRFSLVLSILMFSFNSYSTPWYELYDNNAKLNDPKLWKREIFDLMSQYQGHIGSTSYQSELGSISAAFSRIENDEVVEIIWNYYKKNKNIDIQKAVDRSVQDVARSNKNMQDKIFLEFQNLKDSNKKYAFIELMFSWEKTPMESVEVAFDSLDELSVEKRVKYLENLEGGLVRVEKGIPLQHLEVYLEGMVKRLPEVTDANEAKSLGNIISQLAKWTDQSYLNLSILYESGKINEKIFTALINSISYATNAKVGAVLETIPPKSTEELFSLLSKAKSDPSPSVRAAVAEFLIRKKSNTAFPDNLLKWLQVDYSNDTEAYEITLKFFREQPKSHRKALISLMPELFKGKEPSLLLEKITSCSLYLKRLVK